MRVHNGGMAISDRTRKILWVKAGGRCSICRDQLATEETVAGDPSVFGEEAHIFGKSLRGPRGARPPGLDVDSYENLILLCRKHHKQVDDQINHYTPETLQRIKADHERWVANIGTDSSSPVRLISDPKRPVSKHLRLFLTGTSFWNFFDGAKSFQPAYPEGLDEDVYDLIASFFDNLRDWMDIASDADSFTVGRDAARSLGEQIKGLAQAGLFVGARERFLLLTGGISKDPSSWRSIDIELHPMSKAQIVDLEEKPFTGHP
jgi:hypothetical protein